MLTLLLILFLYSCAGRTDDTEKYSSYSKNVIGGNIEYKNIYANAKDTLMNWKMNKLIGTSESCNYSSFQIDSLFCFNKENNKMISAILESECKEDVTDGLKFFYGVKVEGRWLFFSGAYIVLPREFYQKDIHPPLSFDKLHEIAMKEIFTGYLKKKDKGFWKNLFGQTEYEINDDFFREINTPRVPFENRNTDPNVYYSCRGIDDKEKYEECFFRHEALSVWNEDSAYVNKDTYLFSEKFPVVNKIRKLYKGEVLRVIERLDTSNWCFVRMWNGDKNLGFIAKDAISKARP